MRICKIAMTGIESMLLESSTDTELLYGTIEISSISESYFHMGISHDRVVGWMARLELTHPINAVESDCDGIYKITVKPQSGNSMVFDNATLTFNECVPSQGAWKWYYTATSKGMRFEDE